VASHLSLQLNENGTETSVIKGKLIIYIVRI